MFEMRLRRIFPVVVLLVTFGLGVPSGAAEIETSGAASRPNVILIVADDLDANSISHMPFLKSKLIDKGTTFQNAFVSNALCCPARATILRGQYTHNHQVFTHDEITGGFDKFRRLGHERSTVARWLRLSGYRTSLVGKYLNGYDEHLKHIPPGWTEWYGSAGGFYYDFSTNKNGEIIQYEGPKFYSTDVISDQMVDVVRRSSEDSKPFFLYLAPKAPHGPSIPAPRHKDDLSDVTLADPPSFNEQDISDKPPWIRNNRELTGEEMEEMRKLRLDRLRAMLAVDEMIGRLIYKLEAQGELDNTYILFTSDHGYHLGEHRLPPGKRTAYEEDIKTPLIVRGPGVPAGRTLDHLVLNNDLAPTFARLARTSVPEFVDGRSLVPLLGDAPPPEDQWRSAFLIQSAATTGGKPAFKAVRTEDRIYIKHKTGDRELYDLAEDPYELENLAGQRPEEEAELRARLEALEGCVTASCRSAENGP